MDFNIWIDKNKQNLDYTINIIMNFLNNHREKCNYDINNQLLNDLVNYIYINSSNRNDNI